MDADTACSDVDRFLTFDTGHFVNEIYDKANLYRDRNEKLLGDSMKDQETKILLGRKNLAHNSVLT